ncbi:integrase core domain-containing protein [Jiangella gansuensis]|uniref:integrase core domain-containing protein n=1 Tax=Jiangella gansuensis TaxID=281473 RepID=UPI00146FB818|nr:integrase core domain-containing protein [Jiangella gansuensis]
MDVRANLVDLVLRRELTCAEAAACLGVCRQTMQRYVSRYRDDGVAGLVPRSRRPLSSPWMLPQWVEDEILRVRKEHPRWGARKIRWALQAEPDRLDGCRLPAASTIHQVLVRHGEALGAGVTARNAGQAWRRFRARAPNLLWQLDAWAYVLDDARLAWVLDILDDHSRYLIASRAVDTVSTELAWHLLTDTVAAVGLPARLLTDNDMAFTGRTKGATVKFERQARAAGIELSHGRAWHPQTQGKAERSHATVREWLQDQPPAATLPALQVLLDRHRDEYNHARPHDELDGDVPARIYRRGTPVLLPHVELDPAEAFPAAAVLRHTNHGGGFSYRNRHYELGSRFAGVQVGLLQHGARLHVYYGAAEITTFIVPGGSPSPPHAPRRAGVKVQRPQRSEDERP